MSGIAPSFSLIVRGARANQASCCGDGILPLRRRFGSEGPRRGPGDEVALKIERVVDGGMDTTAFARVAWPLVDEPDFLEVSVLPFRVLERPLVRLRAGENRQFATAVIV
jgi:hypothetical protein